MVVSELGGESAGRGGPRMRGGEGARDWEVSWLQEGSKRTSSAKAVFTPPFIPCFTCPSPPLPSPSLVPSRPLPSPPPFTP
jgi:hypothetical protein